MGVASDKCETRPAHIDAILNGLDRYNPETTTVFQDYIAQQCEDRTFDCYANLALLKLYALVFFCIWSSFSMMNVLLLYTFPIT